MCSGCLQPGTHPVAEELGGREKKTLLASIPFFFHCPFCLLALRIVFAPSPFALHFGLESKQTIQKKTLPPAPQWATSIIKSACPELLAKSGIPEARAFFRN